MTKEQLIEEYSRKYKVSRQKVQDIYDSTYAKLKADGLCKDMVKFFAKLNSLVTIHVKSYASKMWTFGEYVPRNHTYAIEVCNNNTELVKDFIGDSKAFVFHGNGFNHYFDEYVGWIHFSFGDYIVKTNGVLGAMRRADFIAKFEKVNTNGNV